MSNPEEFLPSGGSIAPRPEACVLRIPPSIKERPAPRYNHGYSGLLKHVLDTCLKEYVHKAASVVGVSAGPFGGVRGIQDLLPVLRELGLVTIFWDVHIANVANVFDASGADRAFLPRIDNFPKGPIWMARTLRHGRERITLE
jgi:hypothetical protein